MKGIKSTFASRPTNFNYRTPLKFTEHSRIRMVEYGINDSWVENLWQRSKRTFLPKKILDKKVVKYGKNNISYYSRCGYLLTVANKGGEYTLITITKQKSGNIPLIVKH